MTMSVRYAATMEKVIRTDVGAIVKPAPKVKTKKPAPALVPAMKGPQR